MNQIHEWKKTIVLNDELETLLKQQNDRGFCKFTFKNNLEDKFPIEYLKITHVFEDRDAFVYEHTDLAHNHELFISEYAIGVEVSTEGLGKLKADPKNTVGTNNKKEKDNVYDHLYIHFIVTIGGKKRLFHHSYAHFFENNLIDLITIDGKISDKILKLTTINVFFDPDFDKYDEQKDLNDDMYKLVLQVIPPIGNRIDINKAKIK